MEKKYYFRGFGLGIIITAVIMGIALPGGGKSREMTDEEIIERAKELGMIEDSRLLESSGEQDGESGNAQEKDDAVKKDTASEPVKKDVAVAEQVRKETASDQEQEKPVVATPESSVKAEGNLAGEEKVQETSQGNKPSKDTNEMTKQDEDKPSPSPGESGVSVTIVGGDGSYTVARKLKDAGVVNSADSFDTFLCENGYDKKLRTGTFQIPANASEEQIARIVTGQQ